jgi:hypothetical protein
VDGRTTLFEVVYPQAYRNLSAVALHCADL